MFKQSLKHVTWAPPPHNSDIYFGHPLSACASHFVTIRQQFSFQVSRTSGRISLIFYIIFQLKTAPRNLKNFVEKNLVDSLYILSGVFNRVSLIFYSRKTVEEYRRSSIEYWGIPQGCYRYSIEYWGFFYFRITRGFLFC